VDNAQLIEAAKPAEKSKPAESGFGRPSNSSLPARLRSLRSSLWTKPTEKPVDMERVGRDENIAWIEHCRRNFL
jgi:hypothetical protein